MSNEVGGCHWSISKRINDSMTFPFGQCRNIQSPIKLPSFNTSRWPFLSILTLPLLSPPPQGQTMGSFKEPGAPPRIRNDYLKKLEGLSDDKTRVMNAVSSATEGFVTPPLPPSSVRTGSVSATTRRRRKAPPTFIQALSYNLSLGNPFKPAAVTGDEPRLQQKDSDSENRKPKIIDSRKKINLALLVRILAPSVDQQTISLLNNLVDFYNRHPRKLDNRRIKAEFVGLVGKDKLMAALRVLFNSNDAFARSTAPGSLSISSDSLQAVEPSFPGTQNQPMLPPSIPTGPPTIPATTSFASYPLTHSMSSTPQPASSDWGLPDSYPLLRCSNSAPPSIGGTDNFHFSEDIGYLQVHQEPEEGFPVPMSRCASQTSFSGATDPNTRRRSASFGSLPPVRETSNRVGPDDLDLSDFMGEMGHPSWNTQVQHMSGGGTDSVFQDQ